MDATHIIVGGGTAGCVVASRLSEDPANRVILIEAGRDYAPDAVPADIAAGYAGHALYNTGYFWPQMKVMRRAGESLPLSYEQARVIGGGSSINGQVALRGSPADFDRWEELGAEGWNWNSVLPYFRKLETDLDFTSQYHGASGPIVIRRVPESEWDGFTKSVVASWAATGYARREDMNGSFEDGYAPVPVSHDGAQRSSVVVGYLGQAVRRRANLKIMSDTEVQRLLLDGRCCVGVEVKRGGEIVSITAQHTILCAGSLRSPWLMMKSGIGPAAHLAESGVQVACDLRGVGENLQDHPTVSVVAYKSRDVRRSVVRHNYANLVYSSGAPDAPAGDMIMSVVCKTAWHALGDRLGALSTYIGKPFSRGNLKLSRDGVGADPVVTFNWLSDERDVDRAALGFRKMVGVLRSDAVNGAVLEIFATGFSARVKKISALTPINRLLTSAAAFAMDASALARREIIRRFAADGPDIDTLLANDDGLKNYLRATTTGIWHPSGTCRMGRVTDASAVVDSKGRVIGIGNLSVADASIIPEIPATNLNIPTVMLAERIADFIRQDRRPA
jgi:5-(hydroxymethyl)furfural/furfural oxidase